MHLLDVRDVCCHMILCTRVKVKFGPEHRWFNPAILLPTSEHTFGMKIESS